MFLWHGHQWKWEGVTIAKNHFVARARAERKGDWKIHFEKARARAERKGGVSHSCKFGVGGYGIPGSGGQGNFRRGLDHHVVTGNSHFDQS